MNIIGLIALLVLTPLLVYGWDKLLDMDIKSEEPVFPPKGSKTLYLASFSTSVFLLAFIIALLSSL